MPIGRNKGVKAWQLGESHIEVAGQNARNGPSSFGVNQGRSRQSACLKLPVQRSGGIPVQIVQTDGSATKVLPEHTCTPQVLALGDFGSMTLADQKSNQGDTVMVERSQNDPNLRLTRFRHHSVIRPHARLLNHSNVPLQSHQVAPRSSQASDIRNQNDRARMSSLADANYW